MSFIDEVFAVIKKGQHDLLKLCFSNMEQPTFQSDELEQGKAYFLRNKERLIQQYEGKYIAIWNDEVIDSDVKFDPLAQRVFKKLGLVSIFMPFVTRKPPHIIHIPTPFND